MIRCKEMDTVDAGEERILHVTGKLDEFVKSRHSGLPVPYVWVSGIGCFCNALEKKFVATLRGDSLRDSRQANSRPGRAAGMTVSSYY